MTPRIARHRRSTLTALTAAALAASFLAAAPALAGGQKAAAKHPPKAPKPAPTQTGAPAVSGNDITPPSFTTNSGVVATVGPCVVDVGAYLSRLSPTRTDDTAAFTAAMTDAVTKHPSCYPDGPAGTPQAVVHVPAGTYRLANLTFPSNLRMEVDAGATLQLPADRPAVPNNVWVPMITWDSVRKGQPAIRNVTLIGVGSSLDDRKSSAALAGGVAIAPFDLSHYFTMNLDPASTGSTNYNPGLNVANTQFFLVQNVFSIQNASDSTGGGGITPWPTSGRAVIEVHARKDSPLTGPFLQPMHGVISDQVNVGSPRGYGPNQINAGQDITVRDVYSDGGTALRLETDGSMKGNGTADRGATLNGVVARNIVGQDCNRAVSLAPHAQVNANVDVSGVWAYSCNQGVVASIDNTIPAARLGRFDNATVSNLHVAGGYAAQLDSTTQLWVVGMSQTPVRIVPGLAWLPSVTLSEVSGPFAKP